MYDNLRLAELSAQKILLDIERLDEKNDYENIEIKIKKIELIDNYLKWQ